MPGKVSRMRYCTMLAEVEEQAWAAYRAGRVDNPYLADDPRHDRFSRRLASIRSTGKLLDL
jgi:hypothetical protein